MVNQKLISLYFDWDPFSWSQSLKVWERGIADLKAKNKNPLTGLEIGGRDGGLSLMLANEFGIEMTCTDQNEDPSEGFLNCQSKLKPNYVLKYQKENAVKLSFEDGQFDVVVFKSVLGAVGSIGKEDNIKLMFDEIWRVLKPGGVLLFAENIRATAFHIFIRKKFAPWSYYWNYLSLNEMLSSLKRFTGINYKTFGFFSAFVPNRIWAKRLIFPIDKILNKFLPEKFQYIAFGYAQKTMK